MAGTAAGVAAFSIGQGFSLSASTTGEIPCLTWGAESARLQPSPMHHFGNVYWISGSGLGLVLLIVIVVLLLRD